MKAVVAAFNQEKALVGAFSVITNLWMELFEALVTTLALLLAALGVSAAVSPRRARAEFERFKAEHGRSYGSRAEEEERLRVFSDNLARIEAHNAGGHSWRMGVNKFADLTKYDFLHSWYDISIR